jgi:hypothetical protein
LTDADLAKVGGLGINLVCDFRSAAEKAEEPDRLPATDPPDVAALEIGADSFVVKNLRERVLSGDTEGPSASVSRRTCPRWCTARPARTAPASRRRCC